MCSFSETTPEDEKPVSKAGAKKRKLSTNDAFAKVDKALEAFLWRQRRPVKEEMKKGRRREGKKIKSFC